MTRELFIQLVTQEQESLRRFLLALCCGNHDEADDIAQESFIKAYLSSEKIQDQEKFCAWLHKIAYNTFLDHIKTTKKIVSLENAEKNLSSYAADNSFDYQELYLALDSLSPKERSSILLYYLKGYTIKEISKITDCSEDAVKAHLSRGRKHLKIKIAR